LTRYAEKISLVVLSDQLHIFEVLLAWQSALVAKNRTGHLSGFFMDELL